MTRYIAFLRAINAGKGRTVKMDKLQQAFESLGYSEVRTFIASGNVVFQTTADEPATLVGKIEARLREFLGFEAAVFIRTQAELAGIADYEPFRSSGNDAGADINIIFLACELDEGTEHKVMALSNDTNQLLVHGREIYWLRRSMPGTTNFSNPPLGKTLPRPFTIRGLKTIKKMAKKYASSGS